MIFELEISSKKVFSMAVNMFLGQFRDVLTIADIGGDSKSFFIAIREPRRSPLKPLFGAKCAKKWLQR